MRKIEAWERGNAVLGSDEDFPELDGMERSKAEQLPRMGGGDPRRADRGPPAFFRPGADVCKVWIFIAPGR